MYNREVLMEYTRRTSEKKHCLSRTQHIKVRDGKVYDSDNTSILNFEHGDLTNELNIVKETLKDKNMKEEMVTAKEKQLFTALEGLLKSELKNTVLANVVSEGIISSYGIDCDSVKIYYGNYEIPMKRLFGADNYIVNECETSEIISHLVFAFIKDKKIVHGLLYPAFDAERYGNLEAIDRF